MRKLRGGLRSRKGYWKRVIRASGDPPEPLSPPALSVARIFSPQEVKLNAALAFLARASEDNARYREKLRLGALEFNALFPSFLSASRCLSASQTGSLKRNAETETFDKEILPTRVVESPRFCRVCY